MMEIDEEQPGISNEQIEDEPFWLGTSLADLYNNLGPWSFAVSSVIPTKYHHVLYKLPVTLQGPPMPYVPHQTKHWDEDYVRMPYCPNSKFIVKQNGEEIVKSRWELIQTVLKNEINCVDDLEKAINTYNYGLPKFRALTHFFNEVLEEEETINFFQTILPGIIRLALQLPEILPGNLPYLKRNSCKSVSLSQLQVASLLANAFLCTHLWRKDLDSSRPIINFIQLFAAHDRRQNCVAEKLKCICHYFKRVMTKTPVGCITFERKFIPKKDMPRWDNLDNNLGNTKIHISSVGNIEDCEGVLQVDFANKFIGGGVLGYGCVQEEIRFVICPELIVSRLFVEVLGDNEAVTITGVERYSSYTGYGDTFQWNGNFNDNTPYDEYGRRRTSIVVIDALNFSKPSDQFEPSVILRELNKAYVGFHSREKQNISPIATGNWGCGAFNGNVYLKSVIQLMACSASNRNLIYFTFGNDDLKNSFYNLHTFLGNNKITICQLWRFLCKFCISTISENSLFSFLQQSYFDFKNQPTIKDFFGPSSKKSEIRPSTSFNKITEKKKEVFQFNKKNIEQETFKVSKPKQEAHVYKPLEQVILSQKQTKKANEEKSLQGKDIIDIIKLIDSEYIKDEDKKPEETTTLLEQLDKLRKPVKNKKESISEPMETDKLEIKEKKRRVSDYFQKK